MLVPHEGHLPFMAFLLFFIVTSFASFISFFDLHFTQYPCAIYTLLKFCETKFDPEPLLHMQICGEGLFNETVTSKRDNFITINATCQILLLTIELALIYVILHRDGNQPFERPARLYSTANICAGYIFRVEL